MSPAWSGFLETDYDKGEKMEYIFPGNDGLSRLRRKIESKIPTPLIERLALIPLMVPLFIGAAVVAVLA